jgi:hypothetical protein
MHHSALQYGAGLLLMLLCACVCEISTAISFGQRLFWIFLHDTSNNNWGSNKFEERCFPYTQSSITSMYIKTANICAVQCDVRCCVCAVSVCALTSQVVPTSHSAFNHAVQYRHLRLIHFKNFLKFQATTVRSRS